MLSIEQTRSKSQYAYRNGMSNVAWVAGILRDPAKSSGYIQQTNNLNQMIAFRCEPGVAIPGGFADGQPIKIIGRMLHMRVNGIPSIELEAKRFEMPSIQDMPPRQAWEQAQRAGVPVDPNVPDQLLRSDKLDGWRVQDTGNMAHLAGFVSAYNYEAPKEAGGGCVVILIRQTKDADDLLPVRCYGAEAASLARKLEVGMPLYFEGRISVLIKNTGQPPAGDGIIPTHKYQYLRVRMLNVPGIKQIAAQPDWVPLMIQDARSQRHRAQASKEQAQQTPVTDQVQAVQVAVPEVDQAVATATAATAANNGSIDIPADVLDLIKRKI
jgi:hypothetical protein